MHVFIAIDLQIQGVFWMKYFLISLFLHTLCLGIVAYNHQASLFRIDKSATGPMTVSLMNIPYKISESSKVLKPAKRKKVEKNTRKLKSPTQAKISNLKDSAVSKKQEGQTVEAAAQIGNEKTEVMRLTYAQALNLYISKNKHYPRKARKLRHSGTVAVKFRVNQHGKFEHVHLEKGCNHDSLNKAAIKLIKKLGQFKPLPENLGMSQEFIVPIRYRLAREAS